MTTVIRPEARSLSIIISLRSERSIRAPTTGLSRMSGRVKPVRRGPALTRSVCPKTQMGRAKPVMLVPSKETSCPNQTMVNARIPLSGVDSEDIVFSWRPVTQCGLRRTGYFRQ